MPMALTAVQRPFVIPVPTFSDDRGAFFALSNELPKELTIARVYAISNFGRGTIRGFHKHHREVKMFYIAKGAAKFVTVLAEDDKERQIFVLSDRHPNVLVVPSGWYNGWMSLEDHTILIAMSNSVFQESATDDERVDPYAFGDVWKVVSR